MNTDLLQLVSPCGYCCLSCPGYEHSVCTDEVAIEKTAERANRPIHGFKGRCLGCRQKQGRLRGDTFCKTYECCVNEKGLDFCYQCEEFPCSAIESFPFGPGKKIMKDSTSKWRAKVAELGEDEGGIEWAKQECGRYRCSSCGEPHIRGAQTCDACGETAAADGWISTQAKQIKLEK